MANYIITNNTKFFDNIGKYNFCSLEDMQLGKIIAIDTETTALNPRLGDMFSVQIGTGKNNYLIDMQEENNGLKFEEVMPYIEGKTLVGHNITFDNTFFYKHNFYPNKVFDTFLASKLLYNGYPPNFRHGFGFVMERELGVVYDKSEQKNIHLNRLKTSKAIKYCFNDVDRLIELATVLWNKAVKVGMPDAVKLHNKYSLVLAYMENCGMPFDSERWLEKMEVDKTKLANSVDKVLNYIWENIPKFRDNQIDLFSDHRKLLVDFQSPKQMIPVFQKLNINVLNDKGKKSIKEDVIKSSDHEFVELWLDYKHAQHSVNNFGQAILDKAMDGRIYTSFNPILDTARLSTRRGGINFLNFPANEETRRCIKAKEGYKMIVSDYDGQENSVGADLHGDLMMLKSINDGLDLHCAFARMIFPELVDLSDEEIKRDHSDKRKYSKSPRFAFAYGGTGYTVAVNLNIPISEGNKLEKLFKELHEGVYKWGAEKYKESIENGYIESAAGFRLHLPYFSSFKSDQEEVNNLTREFWTDYKKGKNAVKTREAYKAENKIYGQEESYEERLYKKWRTKVSNAAKTRSKYMRLCLNNPIQSTSAFQTKLALIMLFKYIKENNHLGRVLICNAPHDEIVLEVEDSLCDEYQEVLGRCMREGGDYFLQGDAVKMGAEANVGEDWYIAK